MSAASRLLPAQAEKTLARVVARLQASGHFGTVTRMEITILAQVGESADESETLSLRDWLLHEQPRPGHVTLERRPPRPGEMGAGMDAIQVALGSGGAGAVLAGSVATWLKTRHQHVKLYLKRADGEELLLEGDVKDPEALIDRFVSMSPDAEP